MTEQVVNLREVRMRAEDLEYFRSEDEGKVVKERLGKAILDMVEHNTRHNEIIARQAGDEVADYRGCVDEAIISLRHLADALERPSEFDWNFNGSEVDTLLEVTDSLMNVISCYRSPNAD